MKRIDRLTVMVLAVVFIIFVILLLIVRSLEVKEMTSSTQLHYNTGRIVRVVDDQTFAPPPEDPRFYMDPDHVRMGNVIFEVEMLRGPFSGNLIEVPYYMKGPADVSFSIGSRVSVRILEENGTMIAGEIRHPERSEWLIGSIVFFFALISLIGGKRGMLSVLNLIFTIACIVLILIPLIVAGYSLIFMTFFITVLITISSLTLISGVKPKSISAILGCFFGLITSAIFAFIVSHFVHISGFNSENVVHIIHLSPDAQLHGLFISSILIASIGAITDTCMSIASAMEAVKLANPSISEKALFKAGFNLSQDVIGTMSNTLILAFMGGSLSLMLFMHATNTSFHQFINNEFIAMEVITGVSGSVGIVLAAPFTAIIAAKMLTRIEKNEN